MDNGILDNVEQTPVKKPEFAEFST